MVFSLLSFTRTDILALFGLSRYTNSVIFEIIDIIIMSFVIGYIFSDFFKRPLKDNDPINYYKKQTWSNIKYAAMIVGIAVVLHEVSHKIVAMAFGAQAVLFAPYGFYLIAIILKLVGFPLIFLVGGFVAHSALSYGQSATVAFAGPMMNFVLWGGITLAIKKKWIKKKHLPFAYQFSKINLYLGIFNMLPIPGFDGWSVYSNLWRVFF